MNRDKDSFPIIPAVISEMPVEIQFIIWNYYIEKNFKNLSEIAAYHDYQGIPRQLFSYCLSQKDKSEKPKELERIVENIWTLDSALNHGFNVQESKMALIKAVQLPSHAPFNLAVVKGLLAKGIDVNTTESGMTALMFAVQNGSAAIVEAILIHGVPQRQINAAVRYVTEFTSDVIPIELRLAILRMLYKASSNRNELLNSISAALEEYKQKIWETERKEYSTKLPLLFWMVYRLLVTHLDGLNYSKGSQGEMLPPPLLNELYGNGKFLHKDYTGTELKNFDDKEINNIFQEVFTIVIEENKLFNLNHDIVKLGIDYKVKIKNDNWLISACREGENGKELELIKLLLENKSDVNYFKNASTPLLCAINNKRLSRRKEIITALLENKADIKFGSPLKLEVQQGKNIDIIKILIRYGAKVTKSVYYLASKHHCSPEIMNLLRANLEDKEISQTQNMHPKVKACRQQLIVFGKKFKDEKISFSALKEAIEKPWSYPDRNDVYKNLYALKKQADIAEEFWLEEKRIRKGINDLGVNIQEEIRDEYSSLKNDIDLHKTNVENLFNTLYDDVLLTLQFEYKNLAACKKEINNIESKNIDLAQEQETKYILAIKRRMLLKIKELIALTTLYQITGYKWNVRKTDYYCTQETYTADQIRAIIKLDFAGLVTEILRTPDIKYRIGLPITDDQIISLQENREKLFLHQSSPALFGSSTSSFSSSSSSSSSSFSSSSSSPFGN